MDFSKQKDFYNKLYSVIFTTESIIAGAFPSVIEPSEQICRFCGKQQPDVTFDNVAHAIPHMLGNELFFSSSECDKCNSYFNKIENYLDTFTKLQRTIGHIKGKKGLTDYSNDSVHISHKELGEVHIILKKETPKPPTENGMIMVDTGKMSVLPIALYKSLIKIGLSLMPYDNTKAFSSTKRWLLDKKHSVDREHEYVSCCCRFSLSYILDHVFANVIMRKENVISMPYCWLILAFSNQIYQIVIPCPDKDQDLIEKKEIIFQPYLFPFADAVFTNDYLTQWGYPQLEIVDLSSHEKQLISNICDSNLSFKIL